MKGRNYGKNSRFNSTQVIISVVNDSQLDDVVSAILDAAHTGQKKDGKIFVSEIKETYDISTKQKLNEFSKLSLKINFYSK